MTKVDPNGTADRAAAKANLGRAVISAGAPLTARERRIDKWADEAIASRLTILRTTAQHWQGTISTVIGLFGAASIVGADKDLATLLHPYDYWYAGLAVASLIASAYALLAATWASEGKEIVLAADIGDRVKKYNSAVATASRHLSCSRAVTMIAVALLVAANATRWYAPKMPSPPPAVSPAAKV